MLVHVSIYFVCILFILYIYMICSHRHTICKTTWVVLVLCSFGWGPALKWWPQGHPGTPGHGNSTCLSHGTCNQCTHTHICNIYYIYISTILYIYICCAFMNMYLLIEEFHDRNSRRWLDNVLFVLGFLVISTSISRVWEEVVSASESIKDHLLNRSCRPGDPSEIAIWWLQSMDFLGIFDSTPPATWSIALFPSPFARFLDSSRRGREEQKARQITISSTTTQLPNMESFTDSPDYHSEVDVFVMTCSFSLLRKAIWTP